MTRRLLRLGWRFVVGGALPVAFLGAFLATSLGVARPGAAETALLRGLDKITARVSSFEARAGETVRFGTLDITLKSCRKRPPEETPESAAYLDISETRRGETAVSLFRGWMFASSPALSALEHPVYDIWVLDCRSTASSSSDVGGSR